MSRELPTQTQRDFFCFAHDNIARGNQTMLSLLFGPNPITQTELRALIAKRPEVYGRFAGYLRSEVSP